MKATELIGKTAIRTNYATRVNGLKDDSYTDRPIVIKYATDTHIVFTYTKNYTFYNSGKFNVLNYEFCDDNWIDYDELISGIEPVSSEE